MKSVSRYPVQGDYLSTLSGGRFYLNNPRPEDVDLFDIAHSLALKCRFNGQCPSFYSVAQHSMEVSRLVHPRHALWGLMHDASEAYLPDMPKPFKSHVVGFSELEDRILSAVAERFGLPWPMPAEVHAIDQAICPAEAIALWPPGTVPSWALEAPRIEVDIKPLDMRAAERAFLRRFHEVKERRS